MSRHPSNSLADSDAGPREHWAPLVDDLPPNSRPSPAEIEQYVNPTVHATTSPSVALTTPAEAAQDKENAANQADITPMGLGTKAIRRSLGSWSQSASPPAIILVSAAPACACV